MVGEVSIELTSGVLQTPANPSQLLPQIYRDFPQVITAIVSYTFSIRFLHYVILLNTRVARIERTTHGLEPCVLPLN